MRQWNFKANAALDPTALGCNSERRATWKCRKHGRWVTQIQVRTQLGGPGCPECAQVIPLTFRPCRATQSCGMGPLQLRSAGLTHVAATTVSGVAVPYPHELQCPCLALRSALDIA